MDRVKQLDLASLSVREVNQFLHHGLAGSGIESQDAWVIEGEALVTDVPLTFLGFVNRRTGVVEEPGHPLDVGSTGPPECPHSQVIPST